MKFRPFSGYLSSGLIYWCFFSGGRIGMEHFINFLATLRFLAVTFSNLSSLGLCVVLGENWGPSIQYAVQAWRSMRLLNTWTLSVAWLFVQYRI